MRLVHGRPDWVRATTLQDIRDVFGNIPQVGMGELAARLGAISFFERRGEVIFMDDFEDSTFKWLTDATGTTWSVARSNASALNGNFSVKLTTDAAPTTFVAIEKYLHPSVLKRMGFEYSFAIGSNIDSIYNLFNIYTKTTRYKALLSYTPQTQKLIVTDHYLGSKIIATNVDLREHDLTYHTWKMVVDLETGKYVRLYLNGEYYDLSQWTLPFTPGDYTPDMYLIIYIINYSTGNHYVYVDNVVITQNEP